MITFSSVKPSADQMKLRKASSVFLVNTRINRKTTEMRQTYI